MGASFKEKVQSFLKKLFFCHWQTSLTSFRTTSQLQSKHLMHIKFCLNGQDAHHSAIRILNTGSFYLQLIRFPSGFLSRGKSREAVCDLEQDEHNGQAGQHHHGQEPGQGGQGGGQGDERVQGPKSLFFLLMSISVSFTNKCWVNISGGNPSEDEPEMCAGTQLHVQVWKTEVNHQHPQHSRGEEQVGGGQRGLWGGGRGGADRVEGWGRGQSDCENEEGTGRFGWWKCRGSNEEVELSDAGAIGALLPRPSRPRWSRSSCLDAGEEQECLPQTKVGGKIYQILYIFLSDPVAKIALGETTTE